MLACTLNTTPAKASSSGRTSFSTACLLTTSELVRGCGEGARSTNASSTSMTPKLLTPEPKKTGVCLPARNAAGSQVGDAPAASSMLSMAVSNSWPKSFNSAVLSLSGSVVKSCARRSLPDSNTVMAWVSTLMMPPNDLP